MVSVKKAKAGQAHLLTLSQNSISDFCLYLANIKLFGLNFNCKTIIQTINHLLSCYKKR